VPIPYPEIEHTQYFNLQNALIIMLNGLPVVLYEIRLKSETRLERPSPLGLRGQGKPPSVFIFLKKAEGINWEVKLRILRIIWALASWPDCLYIALTLFTLTLSVHQSSSWKIPTCINFLTIKVGVNLCYCMILRSQLKYGQCMPWKLLLLIQK
jgi:hypothetical protein